ncbi:MAG TPA: InlB B-repeat-containing protein [Clostridiales bacterium]|nr:InlB B-repeat-containing protein [Clostridiales bacterium]
MKKLLSVFLAMILVVSGIFIAPPASLKADAASAGNYNVRVYVNVTDDMDNCNIRFILYGRNNNGRGGETVLTDWSWNDTNVKKQEYNVWSSSSTPYVPTRLNLSCNGIKYYFNRTIRFDVYFYVNGTQFGVTGTRNSASGCNSLDVSGRNFYWSTGYHWLRGKANYFNADYRATSGLPYFSTYTLSGGSSPLTAPEYGAGGTTQISNLTATAKDQYGVIWGGTTNWSVQSVPNATTSVSTSSGDSSALRVTAFSAATARQTPTITASCDGKTASYTVTIYPRYVVNFNPNGDSLDPVTFTNVSTQRFSNTTTSSSVSWQIPANFGATRKGYTFRGWNTNSGATTGTASGSNYNLTNISTTLYAIWTINNYNVKFYDNEIVLNDQNEVTGYETPDASNLVQDSNWNYRTTPQFNGDTSDWTAPAGQEYIYSFKGWNTEPDGSGTTYTGVLPPMDIENQTYYSVYAPERIKYPVTYKFVDRDANDQLYWNSVTHGNDIIHGENYEYGTDFGFAPAGINADGYKDAGYHYTFRGWSLSQDGSGQIYQVGEMPTIQAHTTFYAAYTKEAHDNAIPGEITQVATCQVPQKQLFTCSVCNTTVEVTGEKVGHLFEETPQQEPTCTAVGYGPGQRCIYCNLNLSGEVLPKIPHTTSVLNGYPATCTTDGKTDGEKCDVCGTITVAQKTIPAAHTGIVTVPAIPATCLQAGKTLGVKCEDCDTWIYEQEEIPKEDHVVVTDAAVPATCTEDGLTKGSHCSICGTVIVAQQVVPAKGHRAKADCTVTKRNQVASTCTVQGSYDKIYTCPDCFEVIDAYKEHVILPLDPNAHTNNDGDLYCDDCGAFLSTGCATCDYYIQNPDADYSEDPNVIILPAVAKTCTTAGKTEGAQCALCNKIIKAQKTVAAGHTIVSFDAVPATCTSTGLTAGKYCSACDTWLIAQNETPKKAHKVVNDKAVPATCTTDGKTAGTHCSVCGEVLVAQEVIPATGHGEIVEQEINYVPSTCIEYGSYDRIYVCTVCNEIVATEHIVLDTLSDQHGLDADGDHYCDVCGEFIPTGCDVCDKYYQSESRSFLDRIIHFFHAIKHFFESLRQR